MTNWFWYFISLKSLTTLSKNFLHKISDFETVSWLKKLKNRLIYIIMLNCDLLKIVKEIKMHFVLDKLSWKMDTNITKVCNISNLLLNSTIRYFFIVGKCSHCNFLICPLESCRASHTSDRCDLIRSLSQFQDGEDRLTGVTDVSICMAILEFANIRRRKIENVDRLMTR